eukprot:scaffold127384_cov21-Prasinocladus_malaysianus.AAC.1
MCPTGIAAISAYLKPVDFSSDADRCIIILPPLGASKMYLCPYYAAALTATWLMGNVHLPDFLIKS